MKIAELAKDHEKIVIDFAKEEAEVVVEKIKAKTLKAGDTIGLVAPASTLNAIGYGNLDVGVKRMYELGLNVKFGKYMLSNANGLSGTGRERAEDIMEMFCDPQIKCIMPILGGYNSNEVVEFLDYTLIRKNPKIFIGFSDITALNISILQGAGLINFSGPHFAIFCQKSMPEYTLNSFKKAIMSSNSFSVDSSKKCAEDAWYLLNDGNRQWRTTDGYELINGRDFEGESIGGNLQTLLALNGTKHFPEFKSKVLFLEEAANTTGAEIRRYFVQLRQMMIFDKIKALVVGRFCSSSGFSTQEYNFKKMVEEVLGDYNFPIVYNVDFGHTDPLMTIPIGGYCRFDYSKKRFHFERGTTD